MFERFTQGLSVEELRRISGEDITIKFSKNLILIGRIKPRVFEGSDCFEFVFRQHPSIRVFSHIYGRDYSDDNDVEAVRIVKKLSGSYVSSRDMNELPCIVHLADGRSRYKEFDIFLRSD